MSDIVIDAPAALSALEAEVAEHGAETVYRKPDGICRYAHEGAPSCLIGHALARLGASSEQLAAMDGNAPDVAAIETVVLPAGLSLTPHARRVFDAAQQDQDLGKTWREALESATFARHQSRPVDDR